VLVEVSPFLLWLFSGPFNSASSIRNYIVKLL